MNLVKLHHKYGSAVRIGPNIVSISDPGAIDKIYGAKTDFVKVSIGLRARWSTALSAESPVNV